jgi:uncharacterized protein involved in outer membrane biogenesis
MSDHPALSPVRWHRRRWVVAAAALLALLAAAVALGELSGWPFLAAPIERMLSARLDRRVLFSAAAQPQSAAAEDFRIRFIGGIRVVTSQLEIAAPAWSAAPHMVRASDVEIRLRYLDLWRAQRGQALRIERLQARVLEGEVERLADGRASWQFGAERRPDTPASPVPSFGEVRIANGQLRYRDAPLALDLDIRSSLVDGDSAAATVAAGAAASSVQPISAASEFKLSATGRRGDLKLKIELVSSGLLPWLGDEKATLPVELTLDATAGRAGLAFQGTAIDALHLSALRGHFKLEGPSLSAVGDSLGVTLPTTAAFSTEGEISKDGERWHVVVANATVGASHLNGAFDFDPGLSPPRLSGRLGGTRLLLADLGPVVGVAAPAASGVAAGAASQPAATAAKAAGPAQRSRPQPVAASAAPQPTKAPGKVLPDRHFDLAALRAMDADVVIEITEVDLNTRFIEALRPLHARLLLAGGLLTIKDLDARTGQGRLVGEVSLDGRGEIAMWRTDLGWDGVLLERWIRQVRADGAPPYVSGRLKGKASLAGQGLSTAEILATLKGQVRAELHDGAVSHFAVEVAGLDVAQGLVVLAKGDDRLPVRCAVADLVAQNGVLRPRVLVLDTTESAIWVDGSLSMADESLDLRAVVSPKDFSPLTLRTPLRVRGRFAAPEVSLEKGPMAAKLAGALLLALLNPLAGLIPLVDTGDAQAAARSAAGCRGLMQDRSAATRTGNRVHQGASAAAASRPAPV